ncbi:hypothetical protein J3R30DRAFT_3707386 [Lentinula aciculospora]|uniref:Uncharacterized protein n=1 Tax=Lentinula aciculospora TaxID=153920 RepID=A0A9W9A616_9AGAR|nr:hypothetical protein J3R30DRAFT_3707386 [Lentinula aciculospora]
MAPMPSLPSDEGKRRSSMDKAKVSHLSRQLQLRLQYARLKVEHGWNLNEVENLYFRRTNSRPRQQLGFGPITQTSYSNTSNPQPLAAQSSLSFKAHTFPKISESEQVGAATLSALPSSSPLAISPVKSSLLPTAVLNDSQSAPPSISPTSSLSPSSSRIGPVIPSPVVTTISSRADTPYNASARQAYQPTPAPSPSISSPAHPPTSHSAAIPLSARALQKQPQSVNPAQTCAAQPHSANIGSMPAYPASVSTPTLSAIPTFNQFTSTPVPLLDTVGRNAPSLTYDSFWSTHNASAVAKRPLSFRTSVRLFGGKSGEFGAGIGPGISSGVTAYPGTGLDKTVNRTSSEPVIGSG